MTLPDSFWAKVEKSDACWQWTAGLVQGYGRYGCAGSTSYRSYGTSLAYRIAWVDANGPVPVGLELDHTCNNRACVRPSHLEPVTHEENCRRASERRTHCRNGHAYTDQNRVTQYGTPGERCLECRRVANRESARRQRAAQTAADGRVASWEIREWARANGRQVAAKGPLACALVAEYLSLTSEAAS